MEQTNFAPEQIREQLDKILSTDIFESSVVLSHFLKFIVEETLAGHENELKEYTIGIKALSKKVGFNPQNDASVRIHAGRLRRLLHEYYYNKGKSDTIVISVPKGTYIPEFTNQVKSDSETVSIQNHVPVNLNKISIAVLPFRIISPETPSIFFADGLGDYISTELTRYSDLVVISYYSCRNIAEKITDVREAGLILDAKYILTGTVQYENHRLCVRAQLAKSITREQIWAHAYEKQCTVSELFSLQDEIVRQIISHTAGHYGAIFRDVVKLPGKKNIESPEIYNSIFWYYHFVKETTAEIFHKAVPALQQTLKKDPEYALGWAVLAEIYIGGVFIAIKANGVENPIEESIGYAKTALKIDPLCEHAYQALALSNLFRHSIPEARKAIHEWSKIKPGDSGIMGAMGFCLICCGEYEAGYKMLSDSIHLNPYYQWWYNAGISFYYFHKEEYEEAIYWAEKMNMPHIPWELLLKTASLAEMNQMDAAKHHASQIKERFPDLQAILKEYVGAFLQDEKLVNRLYLGLQISELDK
jgi:TolB-like protein/Tfp pilus assembly protein PilF